MAIDYISFAASTKTFYKLPAPNNMESSSILKHLNIVKELKSLKYTKVFKEAFQHHPRPQGCKVPTKAALLQNSLKRVKLQPTSQNHDCSISSSPLVPSSANPDLNIQSYSP